jgi:hypothetical protein
LGEFNPSPNWQIENLKTPSDRSAAPGDAEVMAAGGQSLGLSVIPKAETFGYEIRSYLSERALALSSNEVKISSDRGELIARSLFSEQSDIASVEKKIEFVLYGHVDGNDYAYHYQFIYNDQSRRVLRASATTLRGDGYEVDYDNGQTFQLIGNRNAKNSKLDGSVESAIAGSPLSVTNTTPGDINCILENLKMCSTYLDLVLCAVTLGTTCLDTFLRNILLNFACGITATCQPLPSFSLSPSSTSVTVRQGQSSSISVLATFTGGFSGPVSGFSVTNLPSGVSASFSPSTITSNGGRVNLNLSASSSAQTGSRTLTISANGGGKSKSTTAQLVVDTGRGTIQINATVNGSSWNGNLAWALTGAGLASGASVSRTLSDMPAGAYGLTYGWGGPSNSVLVSVSPSSQTLNAGTTATFTLNFVTTPNSPSNLVASTLSSSQVVLSWNDNSNSETEFRIERKKTINGLWFEFIRVGANARSYTDSFLSSNTTYYYRVRASNAAGNSGYTNEAPVTTRR